MDLLRERGTEGDVAFLREALQVLVEGIMDAEVSAQIGAQHGQRNPELVTHRNGYRRRDWVTRVGTKASALGATLRKCPGPLPNGMGISLKRLGHRRCRPTPRL